MSQNDSAQERTERPTPKRLLDARKKGQVPRSRELNTLAVMLAGALAFMVFGGWMMDGLRALAVTGLSPTQGAALTPAGVVDALFAAGAQALTVLLPLLAMLLVATLAGPALMGGLIISAEAAKPKMSRLNPLSGLKRIFGMQGLMELFKTLLKFAVLTGLGCALLWSVSDELLTLGRGAVEADLARSSRIVLLAFFVMVGGLVLVAAVDAPFQLYNHVKQLRMTRQEVRDELKEVEGNPEMKARVRRTQQEMANRRMMEAVPTADVVITNPTHYAVALKYGDRPDQAPRLVAKGRDLVAATIRELAEAHGVVVCSAPPLARAIYFNTRLGQEIPAALYLAVARVLAWVYQVRDAGRDSRPEFPGDLPVPAELLNHRRSPA
ncbi:MAG: flagellar biosynthesis protein FlhB [Pseudomonadales bacterium]